MSNIKYRSGDFSEATPIGGIRHESPLLPFLNSVLLFHQDYVQKEVNFAALDYNSPHPTIVPTVYLINESPREDYGGNCVRWTRSWARIPASYDMPGGIYNFQFPGFSTGREPIVLPVALTIHRGFFLCGNFGLANGGYAQWQDIPITRGLNIYEDGDPAEKTDTVSPTSTPSLADYQALVNAGTPIQIEDSKITPIFGSIFVRDDFFVNAK